jgi:hypothetical protein
VIEEDVRLFLVRLFGLDCQFGRHGCGCLTVACGLWRARWFAMLSKSNNFCEVNICAKSWQEQSH